MPKAKILGIRTDWSNNQDRLNQNGYGGVSYYRLIKPLEAVSDYFDTKVIGKELSTDYGKTSEEIYAKIFTEYDLVMIKQVDNPRAVSDLFALANHFKKPVVMDYDDNYLNILKSNISYDSHKPGSQKMITNTVAMGLANGLIVSTNPLKEVYGDHLLKTQNIAQKINVFPNFNDLKDWRFGVKRWNDGKIRIGYAGSCTHNYDLEIIIPAINELFKKYPNVIFEVMGSITREYREEFLAKFTDKDRVIIHYGTPVWQGYPKLLCKKGWDIGVAPLEDNSFTRCKSHIKWMEYTMAGMPVVASNVYTYSQPIDGLNTIEQGRTGFLASSTAEWVEYLSELIEHKSLRKKIQANAYNYIADNWQYSQNKGKLKDILNSYL